MELSDDGYNVLVGSTPSDPILFQSYATHPNYFDAALDSSASGRYQIIRGMAAIYTQRLGLQDFSPVSQDKIAIQMIRERGALPLIEAGNFVGAVAHICPIWASLPGNQNGQHQNDMIDLQNVFMQAGGLLAA